LEKERGLMIRGTKNGKLIPEGREGRRRKRRRRKARRCMDKKD